MTTKMLRITVFSYYNLNVCGHFSATTFDFTTFSPMQAFEGHTSFYSMAVFALIIIYDGLHNALQYHIG